MLVSPDDELIGKSWGDREDSRGCVLHCGGLGCERKRLLQRKELNLIFELFF